MGCFVEVHFHVGHGYAKSVAWSEVDGSGCAAGKRRLMGSCRTLEFPSIMRHMVHRFCVVNLPQKMYVLLNS